MEEITFDQYEFENYLTEEFFNGNDKSEIGSLINDRIKSDEDFRKQYELWLKESGYNGWKVYYQFLEDEEDLAWEAMYPNNEE